MLLKREVTWLLPHDSSPAYGARFEIETRRDWYQLCALGSVLEEIGRITLYTVDAVRLVFTVHCVPFRIIIHCQAQWRQQLRLGLNCSLS